MSDFEPAIEAQLMGAVVVMPLLIEVEFASGVQRFWTGTGTRNFGGHDWQGIGNIVEISEISRLQNGQADPFQVSFVASDDVIRLALIEFAAEALDRPLTLFLQFLNFEADSPLGSPWQIRDGVMRGASLTVDPQSQTLVIKCDTLSSRRNRPSFGMLTDRDQKARFPEDRGLEFIHSLDGKEITWPVF